MSYSFSKYSGCGNDFVLFDNRALTLPINADRIKKLCHRQKSIGADGVILLENSQSAHFSMRIFNSDGSEAEMCGNGIRCLFKFIQECGVPGGQFDIETKSKIFKVGSAGQDVTVDMGSPAVIRWSIPCPPWIVHHLDTGVPHAIIFSDSIQQLDLLQLGPAIRFHPLFAPRGANVNFAQVKESGLVSVRTYERGVEQETLACGTGAAATALAAARMYGIPSPIEVKVHSGDILKVEFKCVGDSFTDVSLIGPAQHIYSGTIAF